MYDFAVLALLALAVVKVVDVLTEHVRGLERMRSVLTFLAGIGAVWALDYSVFARWGVDVRNADTGMLLTGLVVAGMTTPWRALFGWLTHERAAGDETLGEHAPLRAAA